MGLLTVGVEAVSNVLADFWKSITHTGLPSLALRQGEVISLPQLEMPDVEGQSQKSSVTSHPGVTS